jgi:hypothetical protein
MSDTAPGVEVIGKKDGDAYVGYVNVRFAAKPASGEEEVQLVFELTYSRRAELSCPDKITGPSSVSLTIGRSATLRFAECRKENPYADAEISKVVTEKFIVVKRSYVEFFLTISSGKVFNVTWFDTQVRLTIETLIAKTLDIDRGRVQFISAQSYTPAAARRAGSFSALVHGLASSDAEANSLGLAAKRVTGTMQSSLESALNVTVTVTTEVKGTSAVSTELLIGLCVGGGIFLLGLGWFVSRFRRQNVTPNASVGQNPTRSAASDVRISSSLELSKSTQAVGTTQTKPAEKSTAPAMQTIKLNRAGFNPHSYQDRSQRAPSQGGSAPPKQTASLYPTPRLGGAKPLQAQGSAPPSSGGMRAPGVPTRGASSSLGALQAAASGRPASGGQGYRV